MKPVAFLSARYSKEAYALSSYTGVVAKSEVYRRDFRILLHLYIDFRDLYLALNCLCN